MNTLKIFSVAFLAIGVNSFAQDLGQAKKAIDAEKYDKAKSILKSLTFFIFCFNSNFYSYVCFYCWSYHCWIYNFNDGL